MLGAHVAGDVEAPPNLSLLAGADHGPVHEFHHLYRGRAAVVRTRSPGRLVRATLAHLDAYDVEPPRTLRLDGRLLVRDGTAVVIDPMLVATLERVERRVERLGYRVADVAGVPLDGDSLTVVLWPPRLAVDGAALAALNREYPPEAGELELAPTQLPVRALILWEPDPNGGGSPAWRLARATQLISGYRGPAVSAADLGLARRLVSTWALRPCPADDAGLLGLLGDVTQP